MLLHLLLGQSMLAPVHLLGDGEDDEEDGSKRDSGDGGHGLGEQIDDRRGQQHQEHGGQSERDFAPGNVDVRRNLPAALALVLEAQHQHGEAVEGEAPDHAEGVGFAQHVDVAAAGQDGEQLQEHHQVDDAVAGAERL